MNAARLAFSRPMLERDEAEDEILLQDPTNINKSGWY
jgi:hypothetical protein